jgi:RNA polymerase sigma factor (sigma-70 family)
VSPDKQKRERDEFREATRHSLVDRLRDLGNQESWREFFDTYWKLIYTTAVKAGLSDQEAEDVVQETVISVAKKMEAFHYDRSVCTFKGWLLHVTRLRILDQYRKRLPVYQQAQPKRGDTSTGTDPIHKIPDPASGQLESIWNEEWQKNIVDLAMERVKRRVNPEHYQVFHLSVVKGLGVVEVSRMLGTNPGNVYVIKHRLGAMVRKEMQTLEAKQNPNET